MSRRATGNDLKGDRLNRMCHSEVVTVLCSEIKITKGLKEAPAGVRSASPVTARPARRFGAPGAKAYRTAGTDGGTDNRNPGDAFGDLSMTSAEGCMHHPVNRYEEGLNKFV